jgi:hypothetical protein
MSAETLITIFGSGGIIAAIVAIFKLRPETSRIIVSAAEGAVIVQSETINNLHKDVKRLRDDVQEERRICDERLAEQDQEISSLHTEVTELRRIFTTIDERQSRRDTQ